MTLRFAKYEGLGNDFIVVDVAHAPNITEAQAVRLCDRHFGIGADGVLTTGIDKGRPFMRVINADGSRPEMCGNGLRCVALYLVQAGIVNTTSFEMDTDAGPHIVDVEPHRGLVTVLMREASLEAGEVLRDQRGPFIDSVFEVDGRALHVTAVSMGNPHAVLFDAAPTDVETLGPRIEKDPRFRAGANVGFATMKTPEAMSLRVWERGCGFTLACGTGACAAAVAAVETGRAPRNQAIEVTLPGGPLLIRVPEPGQRIEMKGSARRVFTGEVELEERS